MLGNTSAGKSSILNQFVHNKFSAGQTLCSPPASLSGGAEARLDSRPSRPAGLRRRWPRPNAAFANMAHASADYSGTMGLETFTKTMAVNQQQKTFEFFDTAGEALASCLCTPGDRPTVHNAGLSLTPGVRPALPVAAAFRLVATSATSRASRR